MENNRVVLLLFDFEERDTELCYTSAIQHTATWRENREEKDWIKHPKRNLYNLKSLKISNIYKRFSGQRWNL
jgi:hypothetical protein